MQRKHPIQVVDYDPAWPELFEQLSGRIWPEISDIADSIEHVGSTSVPGQAAKPVIDMTIVVPDDARMKTLIERLAPLGYPHEGDQGVPGRESFDRPRDLPRHNLYACVRGNLGLRNHLALRDHLRAHPEDVRAYGELKKQLAEQYPHDIDAYVDGKTALIVDILKRAGFSESEISEIEKLNEV